MNIKKKGVLDLFSGIGGFSKGFEMAGFDVKYAIDNWSIALETFSANHNNPKTICSDVREIEDNFYKKIKNEIDIIIAGPPCQGFSMSGKREIGDPRNDLFAEVIRATKYCQPDYVVIENVVGLLSMKNIKGELIKDQIINDLKNIGYNAIVKTLDASDYSVPQARKRVVFIGSKKEIDPSIYPEINKEKITVGEAFGNVPDVNKNKYLLPKNDFQKIMASEGEKQEIFNHIPMNHNETVQNRFQYVPQGGNWRDIPPEFYNVGGVHSNNYRRLDPKKPSITIKHATKSMIVHPKYDRVITAREAARIQSFPDDFIIKGSVTEQHQQLANAVPVLLGFAIAKALQKKYE
jgi:DNA (cytosine-5)-methyltransferase 1